MTGTSRGERDGVWEQPMEVRSSDVDVSRRLCLDAALKYFQEAAWNHAEHLGVGYSHLALRGQVWLLSRMKFVADSYPEWGQAVTLRTWPRGARSLLALRDFELVAGDGTRLLGGTSGWLVFDLASRRPQRLEAILGNVRIFPERRAVGCDPEKIPDAVTASGGAEVPVKYGDLDLYDHVNNTTYVRWILDTYAVGFHRGHVVREMSINFLAEMGGDDVATFVSEAAGPLEVRHSVRRRIDGTETCRALLAWRKRAQGIAESPPGEILGMPG